MKEVGEQDLNWLVEIGSESQVLCVNQTSLGYECFLLYVLAA